MPKVVVKKQWTDFVTRRMIDMIEEGVTVKTVSDRMRMPRLAVVDKMLELGIPATNAIDRLVLEDRIVEKEAVERYKRLRRNTQRLSRIRDKRADEIADEQKARPSGPPNAGDNLKRMNGVLGRRVCTDRSDYYLDGRKVGLFDCIREANKVLKQRGMEQIPIPSCMV